MRLKERLNKIFARTQEPDEVEVEEKVVPPKPPPKKRTQPQDKMRRKPADK